MMEGFGLGKKKEKEAGWDDALKQDDNGDWVADEKVVDELSAQEERQEAALELFNSKDVQDTLEILETLDQRDDLTDEMKDGLHGLLVKVLRSKGVEYSGPTLH